MAKVHKQKARADIYRIGLKTKNDKNKSGYSIDRSKPADSSDTVLVKKGQEYYWWQFPYSSKQISITYPKPQQLTQSAYLQQAYEFNDRLSAVREAVSSPDELEDFVTIIKDEIEELRSETENNYDNMPEGLQSGPTGELLQERVDNLQSVIDDLDNIDFDYDEPDEDDLRNEIREEEGEDPEDDDEEDKMPDEEVDKKMEDRKQELLDEWLDEKCDEVNQISIDC